MNARTPQIAVALAALALAPALARAAEYREQSDHSVDLAGVRAVRVENARGEVDVRPGPAGTVRVGAVKVTRATGERRARELAADTDVVTETKDGTLEIRVRYPQRHAVHIGWRELFSGGYESPGAQVRLTLEIPAGLALEARTASGSITVLDLTGPLTLQSASGDIAVLSTRGPVSATSASGDIEARGVRRLIARTGSGDLRIDDISGPLQARTTSGSIDVRGAADSVWVRSVSGDIGVAGAPAGLTASTSSGSIDARGVARFAEVSAANGEVGIELVRPLERAQVTTVSGRISGRLADDLKCRLEVRTSSGEMEVMVPMQLKSVSRREVVGVVGGGKAPVVLQTSAGDVELMSGGE